MKIYSWNMLCRNAEPDRAFDFIEHADFDIFCLQEVPEDFLARLRTLPYFISAYSERELLLSRGYAHNYVVTLSKYPITAEGDISFPEYWHLLPLRSRLFVRLMRPFGFTKVRSRSALYTDIDIPQLKKAIRVFNLHLNLMQPAWRMKEFETAMMERDASRSTIVCGDFNIIESPRVSLLNWLFGGSPADTVFYRRERISIEKRFVEHALANPLYGRSTHAFAGSQLDHILVSTDLAVEEAEVVKNRYGSDHHPVRAIIRAENRATERP